MFLGKGFIYLLIFQFILLSDGAFVTNNSQIYDFMPNVPFTFTQTMNSHKVSDIPQDNKTQLIESLASMNDEITVCLVCQAVGCIQPHAHPFQIYHDDNSDSDQNSVSAMTYKARWSPDEDINNAYDERLHNSRYAARAFRSGLIDVALTQTHSQPIQYGERQEHEPEQAVTQEYSQHPRSTVETIITDENVKNDHGDVECGNNKMCHSCKKLFHKKCLSKEDLCSICHQKLSKRSSQQCKSTIQQVHHRSRDWSCNYACALSILGIFVVLVLLGGIISMMYLLITGLGEIR